MASVPPRYRRFFALTDPAATLWPSVAVAGAYLAPGYFSPGPGGLHQFQCNPSLRAAALTPPESVAAISQRSSAPDAAFAVPLAARLPEFIITGLAQRSIPAARSVTPQPHRRVRQEVPRRAFATPTRLLSFTAPWPLPCRDFHSLGCTAFLLVTPWVERRRGAVGSGSSCGRPLSRLRRCLNPSHGPFVPAPARHTGHGDFFHPALPVESVSRPYTRCGLDSLRESTR